MAGDVAVRLAGVIALGLRALLVAYRLVISPLLGPACRFEPSCSHYAGQALARFGLARGAWLAVRRIARCHPWSEGGHDPVPPAADAGAPTIVEPEARRG